MPQTPNPRTTVMVSSTARDLPEHRKQVMDACLRRGMFPVMMEHLPASDAEAAERGPYPLVHADACNVLAQIERDAGNEAAAVEAATRAYQLAWCDGPPFAYHWGLEKARRHLRELGASEPQMPAFDESSLSRCRRWRSIRRTSSARVVRARRVGKSEGRQFKSAFQHPRAFA